MILKKVKKLFKLIISLKYKYLLYGSIVIVDHQSVLKIGRHVKIRSSKIVVKNGHELHISDKCVFKKCTVGAIAPNGKKCVARIGRENIFENVDLLIGNDVTIGNYNNFLNEIITAGGPLTIGDHNFLKCRLWQRFGGELVIGNYNSINQRSEVRADESVHIGSYNMISYDCNIWDTNTHNIYPSEVRRAIMEEHPDFIGIETERPVTAPVYIGDDCWIGRYATLMKGCRLGNRCVVGYHSFLFKANLSDDTMAYTSYEMKTKKIDTK